MGDILSAIVGLVVCFGLPVAGLVALIRAGSRGQSAAEEARRDRVEHGVGQAQAELNALRTEHAALRAAHDRLAVDVAALIKRTQFPSVTASSEVVREAAAVEASHAGGLEAPAAAALRAAFGPEAEPQASDAGDGPTPDAMPTPESVAQALIAGAAAAPVSVAPDLAVYAATAPGGIASASPSSASSQSAPSATSSAASAAVALVAAREPMAAAPGGGAPPPAQVPDRVEPEPPEGEGGGLEQWIGVRGAAALGAIVLVIAGLYFFQYSIEHGLIGPELRVALGALVGLACLVASDTILRTRAPALAPWLGGAGIAILYGSSWALSARYDIAPRWVSGLLMVLTTATATGLAVRREAFPIAVLGLLGGFVTPIALSSGEDHPIPLFSYLLLLDAAILFVSHRRGWPSLGLLALVATAAYQLAWLSLDMHDTTFAIGAGVIVAVAALFGLAPAARKNSDDGEPSPLPIVTRAAAALLPFLFVLTFAFRDDVLAHGWLTVLLTTLACAASVAIGRRFEHSWLAPSAAIAAVSVVAVWLTRWPLDAEHVPYLLALVLLPALIFHVHAELGRLRDPSALAAAGVSSLGSMAAVAFALMSTPEPAVLAVLLALVVLLGLAIRASTLAARPAFLLGASLVAAVAFLLLHLAGARDGADPSPSFLMALFVLPPVAFSMGALLARAEARPALDLAVVLGAALALGGAAVVAQAPTTESWSFALTTTALLLIGLFATARRAPTSLALVLVGAAAVSETVWAFTLPPVGQPDLRLPTLSLAVLTFAAWPLFARNVGRTTNGWRAAALAGPAFFFGLRRGWIGEFGTTGIGLLPVILAALVLAVAFAARRRTAGDPATQRVATVWLAAVAAGFVTLAIPLQLRNEWITIGWALEGAALLFLDYRLRHAGLRWFALALFLAVFVRLSMNGYVLSYYERGDWRIFNWLSYTYLVPVAAMVAGAAVLARHEVESRLDAERQMLGQYADRRMLTGALFAGVVVLVFFWLNLTIFDWYATGPALTIPFERMPARDLTISIVWAVYALVLLVIGMRTASTALRITSLLLLMVTCGKVFLYDLSTLQELYRVAALVGLALSLIVVSLFYQRFVFQRRSGERPPGGPR